MLALLCSDTINAAKLYCFIYFTAFKSSSPFWEMHFLCREWVEEDRYHSNVCTLSMTLEPGAD